MTAQTTITLQGKGIEALPAGSLEISVLATIDVDPQSARRRATAWLVSAVGNMLVAGAPSLVIGQHTVWRVPVVLTSSEAGTIGEVGTVDVDANTGKLYSSSQLRARILDNVDHLAGAASTPAG